MSTNTSEFNLNLNGLMTEINEIKKNPKNIGELVYSLMPINDAGLHLLDGRKENTPWPDKPQF